MIRSDSGDRRKGDAFDCRYISKSPRHCAVSTEFPISKADPHVMIVAASNTREEDEKYTPPAIRVERKAGFTLVKIVDYQDTRSVDCATTCAC